MQPVVPSGQVRRQLESGLADQPAVRDRKGACCFRAAAGRCARCRPRAAATAATGSPWVTCTQNGVVAPLRPTIAGGSARGPVFAVVVRERLGAVLLGRRSHPERVEHGDQRGAGTVTHRARPVRRTRSPPRTGARGRSVTRAGRRHWEPAWDQSCPVERLRVRGRRRGHASGRFRYGRQPWRLDRSTAGRRTIVGLASRSGPVPDQRRTVRQPAAAGIRRSNPIWRCPTRRYGAAVASFSAGALLAGPDRRGVDPSVPVRSCRPWPPRGARGVHGDAGVATSPSCFRRRAVRSRAPVTPSPMSRRTSTAFGCNAITDGRSSTRCMRCGPSVPLSEV